MTKQRDYSVRLSQSEIDSFKAAQRMGRFLGILNFVVYGETDSEGWQEVTFHSNHPKRLAERLDQVVDFGAITAYEILNIAL